MPPNWRMPIRMTNDVSELGTRGWNLTILGAYVPPRKNEFIAQRRLQLSRVIASMLIPFHEQATFIYVTRSCAYICVCMYICSCIFLKNSIKRNENQNDDKRVLRSLLSRKRIALALCNYSRKENNFLTALGEHIMQCARGTLIFNSGSEFFRSGICYSAAAASSDQVAAWVEANYQP